MLEVSVLVDFAGFKTGYVVAAWACRLVTGPLRGLFDTAERYDSPNSDWVGGFLCLTLVRPATLVGA